MTWGDIQILAIQKMFLNTDAIDVSQLPAMRTNKKYAIYLNAMPATANEAIKVLLTRGKPYIKMYSLTSSDADRDLSTEECYCFDLKDVIDDYKTIFNIYDGTKDYKQYMVRFNQYLYIARDIIDDHNIAIGYESYPDSITSTTSDDKKIDLPLDMLNLVPLYLASELYKDDDISLATMYRNEFETELESLRRDVDYEEFTSVNGWL